jgi:AcrR family transcriptional regulator
MGKYTLKRRAEQQAETRRRIVEAVVELDKTIGPAQTTISAIAERAGVERLTVYRHFPDDAALFSACSEHWRAAHPHPDLAVWVGIADPGERLRLALTEVYAYYDRTEAMLSNVLRDAELLPVLANQLAGYRQFQSAAQAILSYGWKVDEQRRSLFLAMVGHALDFETWRSLIVRQRLSVAEAIETMASLVSNSAKP